MIIRGDLSLASESYLGFLKRAFVELGKGFKNVVLHRDLLIGLDPFLVFSLALEEL